MASISTYGQLKDAVKNWLNRSDDVTTNAIPYFIEFAVKDFQRTVQLPNYEVTKTYDITADNLAIDDAITLEDGYYEMKHFFVNNLPYNRVDVDTFYRLQAENTIDNSFGLYSGDEMKGTTKQFYFTRIADKIKTIPALQDGDTVRVIYWEEIENPELDGDQPDYLKVAPDIMLYLSLRHAAVFLRDNDQAQFWEQKAVESAQGLMRRLDLVEWSGSSLVVKEFRN